MQELEHIVKELKARNAAAGRSVAQPEQEAAPAPLFERSGRGSGPAERPAPGVEAERVSRVRREMAAAAPPPPAAAGGQVPSPVAGVPPVQMPRASEPLRAERPDGAAPMAAVRAERQTSAKAKGAAPMRAARDDAPMEAAAPSASASPKRPGRKLFADTPRGRGADGAAAGAGASGAGGGSGGDGTEEMDGRRGMPFWINGLGAAAAVALVLGVGLWTYQLGQRDAMEVPIVRALEGPMRVEPQDPGGAVIAHQGLAVNEVLDGGGVASVAEIVRTAPGDEGVQPEDKAAGALVGLAEAVKPTRRPLSNIGANAAPEVRAAVAIDDVLAIAHQKLADASRNGETTSDAAEREAIDAIVSAIAAKEGTRGALPQVGADDQRVADALQAAERAVAEVEAGIEVAAVDVNGATGLAETIISDTGAAISRPQAAADQGEIVPVPGVAPAQDVVVADGSDVLDAEEVLIAAVAVNLGPTPPKGEGSEYAPVTLSQPRARPRGLAAQMRVAVDAAVGTTGAATTPAAAAQPAPVVTAAQSPSTLDTIPLPAGTRMIQIGAFDSEDVAEQQWARFASLHSDLLGAKAHYVQRTNNSGRVFYRLRVAGYQSKEDTRAACSALSARGLPCISVTLR